MHLRLMRSRLKCPNRHLDNDRHDGVDDRHRGRHDGRGDHGCRLRDPGDGLQLLGQAGREVVGLGCEDDDRRPRGHLRRVRDTTRNFRLSLFLSIFQPSKEGRFWLARK